MAARLHLALISIGIATAILAGGVSAQTLAGRWADEFHYGGPDVPADCVIAHEGRLIIGGGFTSVTDVWARNVAWFDGDAWHAFASEPTLPVRRLVVHDGQVKGLCIEANSQAPDRTQIWSLDGDTWSLEAELITDDARLDLASYRGDLYVGDHRWTGDQFVQYTQVNGTVHDLEVVDDRLLLGGSFSAADGVVLGRLIAWDGERIVRPWPAFVETVHRIAAHGGYLWLAWGYRNTVALDRWDGGPSWESIIHHYDGHLFVHDCRVYDLRVVHEQLLFSFRHSFVYSQYDRFVRWDQLNDTMVDITNLTVHGAAPWSGGLAFVGPIESRLSSSLPQFQPTAGFYADPVPSGPPVPLSAEGHGCTDEVANLEVSEGGLLVTGSFVLGGGLRSPGMIRHDDGQWFGNLRGGTFHTASFVDGTTLASGRTGESPWEEIGVFQLANGYWWSVFEPELERLNFLPGMGTLGVENNEEGHYCIYRLEDGAALVCDYGSIADSHVWDGRLIVGGTFTNHVGWPDGDWYLGVFDSPIGGPVRALGSWLDLLVAAGNFDGDAQDAEVSLWDGNSWSLLPGSFNGAILAVAGYDDLLIVGGEFTHVSGMAAAHVAAWDGTSWHALGSGCNDHVHALAVHEDRVWIGGSFDSADGIPAAYLTWWRHDPVTASGTVPSVQAGLQVFPNPGNPRVTLRFEVPGSGPVGVAIYDLRGRRIVDLVDRPLARGRHDVVWTGVDASNRAVPSGVYVARVTTDSGVMTSRLALVR